MKALRAALLAAGLILGGVGAWYLVQSGLDNILSALWWLVGGVIAHDGLLAPATIALVLLTAPYLPDWLRVPATVGFVVLGTVTVVALPVLGRFGAIPDNPTLLNRNYVGGWFGLLGVVAVGVVLAAVRRRGSRADSTSTGGPQEVA